MTRARSPLVLALAGVLAGVPARSTAPPPSPPGMAVTVAVGQVELGAITSDHIEFSIQLSITTSRAAHVNAMTFSGLRLNGLPLFAAPTPAGLTLERGRAAALPQLLHLNLYYRDLDSLAPVSELLRSGRARIEGNLTLEVGLNWMEKLYLRSGQAEVDSHFQQDVKVQIPGGAGVQASARSAVADTSAWLTQASTMTDAALNFLLPQRRRVMAANGGGLVLVRTVFTLLDRQGQRSDHSLIASGFCWAPNQIIVLKESVEPWAYDADLAATMKTEHLRLDPASVDVQVWPAGAATHDAAGAWTPATGWSARAGTLTTVRVARADTRSVLVPLGPGRPVSVKLERRAAAGDVALLAISGAHAAALTPLRLDADLPPALWSDLAVFRFDPAQAAVLARPALLFVPAGRDGAEVHLDLPLDSSAWGTPLIAAGGVVGMVQSETGGVALAGIRTALGLSASALH